MAEKNIYTDFVAHDKDEQREAVSATTPWEALG